MNLNSMDDILALVKKQADDEGIWFIAETAPEAYLQQQLRLLHEVIESERLKNRGGDPLCTKCGKFS